MEEEQEGIELETINPEVDGIELPYVEDEEDVEVEETETEEIETIEEGNTKTEKEKSLQKGVNEERRRRKEAEKRNKELEARIQALEANSNTSEKTTADELIEAGIDESIAKSIALAIDKKSSDSKTKQELADLKFEMLLTKKSKEEGFEDILDYASEIKTLVDKGLTLEQSYYATTYNKPTANTKSEIERKLEVKMQNQQARKEILGNNISSNSGAPNSSKSKIKATATEKAMAAAAGMSVAEYIAVRDMNSVKDYADYKAKKK